MLLVALMIALPSVLPTLAYASLPDPSWIHGIYDDGDYDDVVGLITSASGAIPAPAPVASGPLRAPVERVPQISEPVVLPSALSESEPRAPPHS